MGIVFLGLFSETFRCASHCWVLFRPKPHCGAASTFQEVVRRLHGSFQFPTVLALHLYSTGTLPILLNAFSGLRLDRAAPCELPSRGTVCGCAETARPFFGTLGKVWELAWPCRALTVLHLPLQKEVSPSLKASCRNAVSLSSLSLLRSASVVPFGIPLSLMTS